MFKKDNISHYSVMLEEVKQIFSQIFEQSSENNNDHAYIDCTFGMGGHTLSLLEQGKKVYSMDRDVLTVERAKELSSKYPNFRFKNILFSEIDKVIEQVKEDCLKEDGIEKSCIKRDLKVAGILWDFGLSTPQIFSDRGFSFQQNDDLDMGMGLNSIKASDVLNTFPQEELADIFYYLGDEKYARVYARKIVEFRKNNKFSTMNDLLNVVESVTGGYRKHKIHPATRILQAIRIVVNDEFREIERSLEKAINTCDPGARLVCISFHSGEDRIVKRIFHKYAAEGKIKVHTKKPITPSEREILENPASRSAKLRWCEII